MINTTVKTYDATLLIATGVHHFLQVFPTSFFRTTTLQLRHMYDVIVKAYNATVKEYDVTVEAHDATVKAYNARVKAYDVTVEAHDVTVKAYDCTAKAYDASLLTQHIELPASQLDVHL